MNPFDIGKQCIKIAKSELFFEQYRIVLKRGKYDIEVRDDYAIKRKQIFLFYATNVQSSVWIIYGWDFYFDRYNKRDPLMKQSAAEVERMNR